MASSTFNKSLDGLVLRTYPSGEADLVLRILTATEGKISAIAKHGRKGGKRLGSNLESFDCGRFELRLGRGPLPVINSFAPISNFHRLRESLDKISAAALLCEISDLLALEGAPQDSSPFVMVTCGLDRIQNAANRAELLKAAFEATSNLMCEAGFLNREALGQGTTKRFSQLLSQVESCLDKRLATRSAFEDVLKKFQEQQTAIKNLGEH